jgi:hypothetical protein
VGVLLYDVRAALLRLYLRMGRGESIGMRGVDLASGSSRERWK